MPYVPRLTAPSYTDKYWIQQKYGGYSPCILISGDSVLPNCVGYAWSRFAEIMGTTTCDLSRNDACKWFGYSGDSYERGNTPRLGAVICWRRSDRNDGGHVAIVEQINADGSIITSNSAYGGKRFYMKTLQPPNYVMGKSFIFQGFIYNPVVTEYGTISPQYSGLLYDTQSTREDATIREVGYMRDSGLPTVYKTDMKMSVINYTTILSSMVSGVLAPNNINGSLGENYILDNIENQNARIIVRFFIEKALPLAAAVGIAVNIGAESKYDTATVGNIKGGVPTTFGICQWSDPKATAMKKSIGPEYLKDLTGQLEYLWDDMNRSSTNMTNDIRTVANNEFGAKYAAKTFAQRYIKIENDPVLEHREELAVDMYNKVIIQQTATDSSTSSSLSTGAAMSGTTITIPASLNQSGIVPNYTNYTYFYSRWGRRTVQRKIADLWDQRGRQSNRNIATLDGYYLCAVTLLFGTTGDKISIVLDDGTIINAVIADSKGDDPSKHGESGNAYGHSFGNGKIDIVEWEAVGPSDSAYIKNPVDISGWKGKKIVKIINGGSYL